MTDMMTAPTMTAPMMTAPTNAMPAPAPSRPGAGWRAISPDRLSAGSLATLGKTLESGIDERLQSTRAALRAWVRDAVERAARQTDAIDPVGPRRRRVMDTLRLGSPSAADILLLLVDEPDTYHDNATLAALGVGGGVGLVGDRGAQTNVPARIWQLRSRLMIHGLGEAIRNRSRRGYFISRADAAAIKALWDEDNNSD